MWSTEATIQLIENLESKPMLWDVNCDEYRDKQKKADAINEIANNLSKDVYDVEKKIRSLRVQFNREHQKLLAIQKEGGKTSKRIVWFGYTLMQFLVQGSRRRSRIKATDVTYPPLKTEVDEDDDDIAELESQSVSEGENISARASILESALKKKLPVLKKQHFKFTRNKKQRLLPPVQLVAPSPEQTWSSKRDKYEIFGESVAISLRDSGRSLREISIAKHKINKVLFDLEMGYFAHEVEHRPSTPNGDISPIVLMSTE